MPYYELGLTTHLRIAQITKRHKLKRLPRICLCTDPSVIQIGAWQFLAQGTAYTGDFELIVIYIHQNPGIEFVEVGKMLEYRQTFRGCRKFAMVLAHEIRHIMDGKRWWHDFAGRVYPCSFTPDGPLEMTFARKIWRAVFRAIYYLHPLEFRARAYSLLFWRRYYRAIYGLTPFQDAVIVPLQDMVADVFASGNLAKVADAYARQELED